MILLRPTVLAVGVRGRITYFWKRDSQWTRKDSPSCPRVSHGHATI